MRAIAAIANRRALRSPVAAASRLANDSAPFATPMFCTVRRRVFKENFDGYNRLRLARLYGMPTQMKKRARKRLMNARFRVLQHVTRITHAHFFLAGGLDWGSTPT